MGYEYGDDNAEAAPDAAGNAGACPPKILEFRIYPQAEFNDIFGNPPANVVT